jgi:hypothetical protein
LALPNSVLPLCSSALARNPELNFEYFDKICKFNKIQGRVDLWYLFDIYSGKKPWWTLRQNSSETLKFVDFDWFWLYNP